MVEYRREQEEEEVQLQTWREMLTESECPVLLQWTNMSIWLPTSSSHLGKQNAARKNAERCKKVCRMLNPKPYLSIVVFAWCISLWERRRTTSACPVAFHSNRACFPSSLLPPPSFCVHIFSLDNNGNDAKFRILQAMLQTLASVLLRLMIPFEL